MLHADAYITALICNSHNLSQSSMCDNENINNASDKQKWYYDYKINFKPYSVGDAFVISDLRV
jgi:ribosomal protein L11 methylase PrmA